MNPEHTRETALDEPWTTIIDLEGCFLCVMQPYKSSMYCVCLLIGVFREFNIKRRSVSA